MAQTPLVHAVYLLGREMEEKIINEVSSILNSWNPLGEATNSIEDLSGYRYEAIDIISTVNIMAGPSKAEKSIQQVLFQAFDIELDKVELSNAARDISAILGIPN